MNKIILVILSISILSCKNECKIISFSEPGSKEFNVNIDEKTKEEFLSDFTLDEKNRVLTQKYSTSSEETYEVYYKYDPKNRLKEIKIERYVLSQLFVTEVSTFIYNDLNPIKIEVQSKVNNHSIGLGADFKSEYFIEYNQNVETISQENFDILSKLSQSMLQIKGDFLLQSYLGLLPNKLIKSIIIKTEDTPSIKTTYNYKKDKENKIVEIEETTGFEKDENTTTLYKINYNCN
jgi:hypothetical protein